MKMDSSKHEITIKQMIAQYQKINGPLTDKFVQINSKTHGQFVITKCQILQRAYFMSKKNQCLFFTNISKNKNIFRIGYFLLTDQKIDHQIGLQQFVEKSLRSKSSYIQSNAIKQVKYDADRDIAIDFKKEVQEKDWKLTFDCAQIAKVWGDKLNNIINISKTISEIQPTCSKANQKQKVDREKISEIHPNWCKINQNQKLGLDITSYSTQKQLLNMIIKSGVGTQLQIERTLKAVTQMSKTPVQLTVYIISKIKSAVVPKQLEIKVKQKQNIALKDHINQLQTKQQQLQRQLKRVEKRNADLELKNVQLSKLNHSQQIRIDQLNALFQSKKLQCEDLQIKLNECLKSTQQLKTDKSLLGQKLNDVSRQLSDVTSKLQAAKSLDTQNNSKIAHLTHQLAQSNQKIQQQKLQIQRLLQQKRNSLEAKQSELKVLTHKLTHLTNQLELNNQKNYQSTYLHIFEGLVLHDYFEQKEFLRKSIENYTKRRIQYTHLLYRFDNINKANFHKYIDQHSHICLVVRLSNGMVLAGYSQDPISGEKPATNGGLICSLTSRLSFQLLKGLRSVTYDDYFLIFGNSQLRIRWGELMLFSNFAISNGYYDARGEKYTVLMGSSAQRTQKIESYQIFEVKFN